MIYNIIGLLLDFIGVILLFRFGILPDNLWEHILMDNEMSDTDIKKHKIWSKIALITIIIGFGFQIIGTFSQNTPFSSIPAKSNDLGFYFNQTTQIKGHLSIKFEDEKLHYQLELKGPLNNYKDLEGFKIQLEDKDGFRILQIAVPYNSNNENISSLISNNSLTLIVKGNLSLKPDEYLKIKKWNFTAG
ncbi:hypothetical protein AAEO56_16240 [Flavobacterium sp. DGU11]|uniref:Uncharacterized protein n=1 Tax=Flavobacterium arundinis TaxID=3139143 RepID=A0ABU9I075_9FLAO